MSVFRDREGPSPVELLTTYLHLLDEGHVTASWGGWRHEHWPRFLDQEAARDGVLLEHTSYLETSFYNDRVLLLRPDGTRYELPRISDTAGKRAWRARRKMWRLAREEDWGDTLAAAQRRARAEHTRRVGRRMLAIRRLARIRRTLLAPIATVAAWPLTPGDPVRTGFGNRRSRPRASP